MQEKSKTVSSPNYEEKMSTNKKKVVFNHVANIQYLKQKTKECRGKKLSAKDKTLEKNRNKPLLSEVLNNIEERYEQEINALVREKGRIIGMDKSRIKSTQLESKMKNLKDLVEDQLSNHQNDDDDINQNMFQCTDDDIDDLEEVFGCCPQIIGSFSYSEDSFTTFDTDSYSEIEYDESKHKKRTRQNSFQVSQGL